MTAAEKAVARLEKAVGVRERDLEKARVEEQTAVDAFDASGASPDLDAASRARLVRESAERKLTSERMALDMAQADLRKEQRETALAEHSAHVATLAAWPDALAPVFGKLAALDADLFAAVMTMAGIVADAQKEHDVATERAKALGLRVEIARPSLDEVQLQAQRAIDDAREADGREAVGDWLAVPPKDWRHAGMNAAEIAQSATFRSRAAERLTREGAAIRDGVVALQGATVATAPTRTTPSNGAST